MSVVKSAKKSYRFIYLTVGESENAELSPCYLETFLIFLLWRLKRDGYNNFFCNHIIMPTEMILCVNLPDFA